MLKTISWSNYVIAICILLFIWYLYVILKYYSSDIKQILQGTKKIDFKIFGRNKFNDNLFQSKDDFSNDNLTSSFATLDEVKELSTRLISAIAESAERKRTRAEYRNYLILILEEYPYVKISSLRNKIDDLLISESAKYSDLALNDTQVAELWEETI